MTGERRRREWAEEFDIIWHGALTTDGTTKGGLLQPREQKVDPRWALLDSMGGPGAFKDGSMQSTRKRIMAKGQRGTFHRSIVPARQPFRERARAEVDEANAKRVALCRKWTGRA